MLSSSDYDNLLEDLFSSDPLVLENSIRIVEKAVEISSTHSPLCSNKIFCDCSYLRAQNYCIKYVPMEPNNKRQRTYEYSSKLPRIVKRDVRRMFPEMFFNLSCSEDLHLIHGFFDTYCVNNFQMESYQHAWNSPIEKTNNINGSLAVTFFLYAKLLLIPDLAITITDAIVIQSEDETQNRIVAKIAIKGTKFLSIPNDTLFPHLDLIQNTHKQTDLNTLSNTLKNILQAAHDFADSFPLLHERISVETEGTLTMFTDSQNRITKFVLGTPPNAPTIQDIREGRKMAGRYGIPRDRYEVVG
jgi:hypothetical protein